MVTLKKIEEAKRDDERLSILREMFSTQIVLAFFANPNRFNVEKRIPNVIARDNLLEIVGQTKKILDSEAFQELVTSASNVDMADV